VARGEIGASSRFLGDVESALSERKISQYTVMEALEKSSELPLFTAASAFDGGYSMNRLQVRLKRFLQAEDGPTAVEYAVMLALIVVVCIAAITTLGTAANDVFSNVSLNVSAGS